MSRTSRLDLYKIYSALGYAILKDLTSVSILMYAIKESVMLNTDLI